MPSKIEWTDETWNPITGCTKISPGCKNCYAERMAKRLAGRCGYPKDSPFEVALHPDKLDQPLRWRKPRRVFVCSMGDLFHEDVPTPWIYDVFQRMESCPQHIFMLLTKRPERMRSMVMGGVTGWETSHREHIWLGVTAENQEQADKRIPVLLSIPAAVRFVSVEPMLSTVDLCHLQPNDPPVEIDALNGTHGVTRPHGGKSAKLDWVICGGESGPGARPMHPDWARGLRDQCVGAGVPFFFKQGPGDDGIVVKLPVLDGKTWGQCPEE
uniref:Phage protein Gp37/Gp68 n=1 Tax=viral metagenome TaxID=1070528 RepID=A0A6H1ZDZ4_9ZZZZ